MVALTHDGKQCIGSSHTIHPTYLMDVSLSLLMSFFKFCLMRRSSAPHSGISCLCVTVKVDRNQQMQWRTATELTWQSGSSAPLNKNITGLAGRLAGVEATRLLASSIMTPTLLASSPAPELAGSVVQQHSTVQHKRSARKKTSAVGTG